MRESPLIEKKRAFEREKFIMSKKSVLKKSIAKTEAEIDELEKKRNRSQSSILEAYLSNQHPTKADVEYFRTYSKLIEVERENLRKLQEELSSLKD